MEQQIAIGVPPAYRPVASSGSASPAAARMEVVDAMRGLAALSVSWFHLTNAYEFNWVRASGHYGWLGVEIFFVISGFVVPFAIWRRVRLAPGEGLRNFLLRRMVRLEPPYVASIVLVIALAYASSLAPGFSGSPFRLDAGQVISHFFYLVPLTGHEWLSPIYWTLAYEFVLYLACGLLFGVISSVRPAWTWYALAFALVALSFGPMPARALLFVMGIAVFRRLALREPVLTTLLTISGAGLAIAINGRIEIAVTGMAGAAAILLLAPVRLPSCRLLRAALWLGTVSYSLYLTHVPVYLTHVPVGGRVVNLGRRFIDGPTQELLLSLVALAVCLAFAAVFWRLVERSSLEAGSAIGSKSAAARARP